MFNHNTKMNQSVMVWAIAFAPFLWLALVFLYGTLFSFPQTDDFCTFNRLFNLETNNPFRDAWYMYLHWSGRYTSMFLISAAGWLVSIMPSPMYVAYSLALMLLILTFAAGCLTSTRLLSATRAANIPVAAIAFAASMMLMPSRLEGVFWLTGAIIYVTGVAVLLIISRSIIRDDRFKERSIGASYSWTSLILIVGCVGFNELLALSLGEFLVIRAIFYARGKVHLKQNIAYAVAYLGAFVTTVLAPGNFARDAGSSVPRHKIGIALDLSMLSFSQFIHGHIVPNATLLTFLLLGAGLITWAIKPTRVARATHVLPLPLTLISALPLHLVVYSFLTGEAAPGRIINQCYVMALVGLCLLTGWAGMRIAQTTRNISSPGLARFTLFAIGIICLSTDQFGHIASVLRDFGPTWRAQQTQRMEILRDSKGRTMTLAPFSPEGNTPPILQGADIDSDPSNWINKCVSDFYGVKDVRLENNVTKPGLGN
jgi:hypothetical protein